MPFPYDPADLAALDRLANFYNGADYDASSNPGGMGRGGHRVNFENALADAARVGAANAAAAAAAGTSAGNAATSEANAAASAARLIGSSASSVAIAAGSKAFVTQAGKFFAPGTFVLIYSAANPTVNYMAGQAAAYSGTDLTVDVTVTKGSGTFSDWVIAVAGAPGGQGLQGLQGPIGPTPDVMVTFSDGVTDSDPGNGLLKFNNALPGSTTQLYVDDLDRYGTSIAAWIDSFDDSTNTALRGTVKLVQVSDPTKYARFDVVGAVVNGTGYRKIPVAHVLSRGVFTNGAILAIDFTRTGDKGVNGDGAGDVLGPATATDNHVALFDGGTGKLLKSGGALAAVATSGVASDVVNTPAGGISATNVQAAINELDSEKAPKVSPALAGTPTAPTASTGTNTTQLATTAFVKAAIEALIASAPGALDTLNELAASLGNDANFAATMTAALAGKQASLGFTPVRQGGGAGQGTNTVRAGWNATLGALTAFTDSLDLGRLWTDYNAPLSAGFTGEARLPNGVSLKWGTLGHASADYVHVFPNAFVASCWEVIVTPSNRGIEPAIAHVAVDHDGITASGFTVRRRIISPTGVVTAGGIAGWYFAIGN